MKRRIQQHALILIAALVLAACAELAKHAETIKPTARLTDVRLAGIDFEQADLVFDLAVDNQNPVAIDLAGLNYDLKIEDHSLVSGVTAQGLEIKPASTSTVQLPVKLKFADLKKLPGDLWKQDRFEYRLDSEFIVNLPIIGNYAIPVSKTGELPVPRAPEIRLKGIDIESQGLKTAERVARVDIANPNAFDLAFSEFDYQLNVNQQKWGLGTIRQGASIPQKGSGTVEIPLKLDLLSMGQTAYKALTTGQPVEYRLTGGVTLDTGMELRRDVRMPVDISGETPVIR